MADGRLENEDLAPVPPARRTWSVWHIAALWVGMAVCIPTYQLASGLVKGGLDWRQALLAVFVGNAIVLVPLALNGHGGTKYGIPFPVLARASFGVLGANVATLPRALVACGWFGIQSWIGGAAIWSLVKAAMPGFGASLEPLPLLGINAGELACFVAFWAVNLWFIVKGTESIKWLEVLSAPFLLAAGLLLLWWAWSRAGSFAAMLSSDAAGNWAMFWPSVTAMVGFWATLSLNIPDFTRFARSQRDQVAGQALGLPTTMTLFAFIGVAVTSATPVIVGETVDDPVALVGRVGSPLAVMIAMFALSIATLSTNIAANVVGPANDFSNLAPKWVSFRTGGLITAGIGLVMMPWKIIASTNAYIFTWLVGYSALLGPIVAILLADYYVVRRRELVVEDLYRRGGVYEYSGGFNWRAIAAFAGGALPCIPGFLKVAGANVAVPGQDVFDAIYRFAWFVSFGIGFLLYVGLTRAVPVTERQPEPAVN